MCCHPTPPLEGGQVVENKEALLKKWIAALRSGKYKQTREALARMEDGEKKFCCLGVLCDLVDPTKWENFGDGEGTLGYAYEDIYGASDLEGEYPPPAIQEGLFMDLIGDPQYYARLNDEEHKSFSEIATALEEDYLARAGQRTS